MWYNFRIRILSSLVLVDWRGLWLMARMALGDPRTIKGKLSYLKKKKNYYFTFKNKYKTK
jgi:hypothetical protein